MEFKICRKCGIVKPTTEYYRSRRDGHYAKCKQCMEEYSKAYLATPKGKAMRAAARRRYRQKHGRRIYEIRRDRDRINPEKKRARSLIGHRIERGKWKRQPCEICGLANAQAHHPDYSKPLEVMWLCPVHHAAQHIQQQVL